MPLQLGSPAIEAGSVGLIPSGVIYDQLRGAGFPRTMTVNGNVTVDIGVYQYQPVVTAISPATGPTGGGTAVTITGIDLTDANAVDFGTNAATNVQDISATEVTATSPAGAAGTVDVTERPHLAHRQRRRRLTSSPTTCRFRRPPVTRPIARHLRHACHLHGHRHRPQRQHRAHRRQRRFLRHHDQHTTWDWSPLAAARARPPPGPWRPA